jgi:hypothetical protein
MSKYSDLYIAMGGPAVYNDKVSTGRVLKWYSPETGLSLSERKAQARLIAARLKHLPYVQKVNVRNARGSAVRGNYFINFQDSDKICVYVDMQKLTKYTA